MRRWVAILLIGLILFPVPLLAAVTVDSSAGCGGTNSASCSLTIAADANAVMVCFTQRDTGSAVQPGVSASVGGQAATFLGGAQNSGNSTRVEFWYKLAPLTGAQTIAVTGDAATDRLAMAAVSLKNVAQTSTFNTKSEIGSTVNGTNADLDGIASAVGEFVFLCGGGPVSKAQRLAQMPPHQFQLKSSSSHSIAPGSPQLLGRTAKPGLRQRSICAWISPRQMLMRSSLPLFANWSLRRLAVIEGRCCCHEALPAHAAFCAGLFGYSILGRDHL